MRFTTHSRRRNDDERVLPLINVVFLLLIFFMLAGRLAASDPFQVEPVHSVSEAAAPPPELQVLIGADGQLALDGEIVDEAALRAEVSRILSEDSASPVRLRLKADGRVSAARVVDVMELLRDAGIETLKLLTVPKRR